MVARTGEGPRADLNGPVNRATRFSHPRKGSEDRPKSILTSFTHPRKGSEDRPKSILTMWRNQIGTAPGITDTWPRTTGISKRWDLYDSEWFARITSPWTS